MTNRLPCHHGPCTRPARRGHIYCCKACRNAEQAAAKSRELKPPTRRPSGPVEFSSKACRLADDTWLPMTVYYVADRECAWWHVGNFQWHLGETARTLQICPIVTYLPSRYFVGNPNL